MVRIIRYLSCVAACVLLLCVGAFAVGDEPPNNPPFYGSCYVSGNSSELGDIDLYFPISYKDGYLGVDDRGYLFNVSNTSITCYLEGYDYCNIPAWSYPRYREQDGNSWDYIDLHLEPEYSNAVIATEMVSVVTLDQLIPYCILLFLGVIFVCCMKRS